LSDYPFGARDINQWSTIRAIASIYRRQIEAEDVLGLELDWMREMGYDIDQDLLAIVTPFQKYDYSDFYVDSAFSAQITCPETPEELFANCKKLIKKELGARV
jgi:hypothetical protein